MPIIRPFETDFQDDNDVTVEWRGDRLVINGEVGPSLAGPKGKDGTDGKDGAIKFESLTQAQKDSLKGDVSKNQLDAAIAESETNRAYTITAKAGRDGLWLANESPSRHKMDGLYLMVLEGAGTNPPRLNLRGGDYGTYGIDIKAPETPHIRHVNITNTTQIILMGSGEGDGKTRATFIKLGTNTTN